MLWVLVGWLLLLLDRQVLTMLIAAEVSSTVNALRDLKDDVQPSHSIESTTAQKYCERCIYLPVCACKQLNLPTLKYRRIRGDMIEVYKIFSGKYDDILTS